MISAGDLISKFRYALDNHWGYIWGTAGEMWTESKQRRIETTLDDNRKSAREYGAKWINHMVTDCSGLFSWAFSSLGGYMYHGSNTMWSGYCIAHGDLKKGKRTDGLELLPGTAVFCCHGNDRTHVGLYVGDGQVIEASGTVNGVIIGKITNSKWVEWGELKGVQYGGGSASGSTDKPDGRPTLRRGAKGSYVTLLQTALINRGYDLGTMGADGDFGSRTERAVQAFQRANRLEVDGIVGPLTWAALDDVPDNSVAAALYEIRIGGLTKDQVTELLKEYPKADVIEERGDTVV